MTSTKIYHKFVPYYDRFTRKRFYLNYCNFIVRLIKQARIENPALLDLACGTGRLLSVLRRHPLFKLDKLEGLDCSHQMIKEAKRANCGLVFYHQRLEKFHTGKKYDVILCTFDSVNYILNKKELRATFKNVRKALLPKGIFVFDFNTVYKKVDGKIVRGPVTMESKIEEDVWHINILIKKDREVYIERHVERLYSAEEVLKLLKLAGFKKIDFYNKNFRKLSRPSIQERLVVVAN